MQTRCCALLVVLAACGGDDGSSSGTPDAAVVAPTTLTVSGNASSVAVGGKSPEAGVVIAAYKISDENTVVAMTTTDASGNYSLTITTDGTALDGYLKATKSGFVETYLYPPAPLAADFGMASINMLTPQNYGFVYTLTQVSQAPDQGIIGILAVDSANMAVAGATISSTPATTYRYNGTNGLPAPMANAMATQSDGLGYMVNVPPGQVTVTAAKSGLTFKSHQVKARANQLVTTIVQP
jgi:hypothetical protein